MIVQIRNNLAGVKGGHTYLTQAVRHPLTFVTAPTEVEVAVPGVAPPSRTFTVAARPRSFTVTARSNQFAVN